MPAIFPLRGIRYSSTVGRLDGVVAPPYDVISPEAQTALYRRSPYNVVRVVYGRGRQTDRPGHDRYTRARALFLEWLRQGILRMDRAPACYPYRQRFRHEGRAYDRWGLVGLIRLGEPTIFPHEETSSIPKQDRLQLLQSVQANLSPIFGLVDDADRRYRTLLSRCAGRPPLASVMFEGIQHDLWRITVTAAIHRVQAMLESQAMLLADGHHRYEVAMAYRDQLRQRNGQFTPHHPANFMLAYVAAFDAHDPGILPTHRVFGGLGGWTLDRLAAAASWLTVERMANDVAVQERLARRSASDSPAVGCYAGNGQWAVATLTHPDRSVRLDVELLHRLIVPRCLAPDPLAASRLTITYTQEWGEAVRRVDQRLGTVAWRLRPPTFAQIIQCVKDARRLPQKSTYFLPKPLAGLVIHRLRPVGVPPRRPMRTSAVPVH